MPLFSEWQNFYVIVGSSAGALIGLQFVVMALIAEIPNLRRDVQSGQTFATPTFVHFVAALLLAALMSAPWHSMEPVQAIWGIGGLAGLVYYAWIARQLVRQSVYKPQFEDWLFFTVLPFAAYGVLMGAACSARRYAEAALFAVAGATILLLLIGIHNAWDTVTYHIFNKKPEPGEPR